LCTFVTCKTFLFLLLLFVLFLVILYAVFKVQVRYNQHKQ